MESPFADLAELPDGPLGQLLSTLTIAELRMLPLVSHGWFLDGARNVLWYGLAAHHGVQMPKVSSRVSLRSKADLRRTFFAQHAKDQATLQRFFDHQADWLVASMRFSDSVAPLRRALEAKSWPLPVAHELGGQRAAAWSNVVDSSRARPARRGPAQLDESTTLLHAAARYGRLRCARLLLDSAGESTRDHPLLELKDAGGFTPLLMAAWCGHLKMVKLLLSRGASTKPEGVPPMTSACGGVGPYDAETWASRKGFTDVELAIHRADVSQAIHDTGINNYSESGSARRVFVG